MVNAETSTFFTADSPVPSDALVNFNTATLSPSWIVCEVTVSFGIQNGEAAAKTMTIDYVNVICER